MKFGIAIVAIGATLAIGAIGAATASASSAVCRAPDTCKVVTTDDRVEQAVLVADRDTRGAWSLRCSKGSHDSVQRGLFARGARKIITPELPNAECVFRARGNSPGIAKVRLALTS